MDRRRGEAHVSLAEQQRLFLARWRSLIAIYLATNPLDTDRSVRATCPAGWGMMPSATPGCPYVAGFAAMQRAHIHELAGAPAAARDMMERFEQGRDNRRRLAEWEESLKELRGGG